MDPTTPSHDAVFSSLSTTHLRERSVFWQSVTVSVMVHLLVFSWLLYFQWNPYIPQDTALTSRLVAMICPGKYHIVQKKSSHHATEQRTLIKPDTQLPAGTPEPGPEPDPAVPVYGGERNPAQGPPDSQPGSLNLNDVGNALSSGGFAYPVEIENPHPSTDPEFLGLPLSGNMILQGHIETDGLLSDLVVVRGVDSKYDEAIRLFVLKNYRFKPALENGRAVRCGITIEIPF